jgi:hypothetical protein
MNMKKYTLLFILLLFCAAGFAQSGTAGKLKWSLSGGTLTISRNGAMPDYSEDNSSPWDNVKGDISAVIIKNGVTSIGEYAFSTCISLKLVTIPNSVTTIGHFAFSGCIILTSVTIPNSVTTIGGGAFLLCMGLKDVTVEWTTPLSIESTVFSYVNLTKSTLHVPSGTAARYRAADGWKDFGKIVEQ